MNGLSVGELTLSHFRSHKGLKLAPAAGPVAIYGSNGAGKTNILEAVSLLSPGRGLRRARLEDMSRRPEALGWKISAVLNSMHQIHEVETSLETGTGRSVRIDEKATTQLALGRIARVLWLVPSMDRLWIEGADGRRRFLDRMTLSFEPAHADATLTYEKAMRERNRLLKDQINEPHWYRALESQMATAGARIISNRANALIRVSQAQENAKTAFPTAILAMTNPETTVPCETEQEFAAALEANRPRDIAAGRTLIGPHRADLEAEFAAKGTSARQCSTGEQKALLISLILANARALADDFGAPPLLLLDEVAAHLDGDRRAALFDEICAIGAQAWMTGTGAELFDALKGRAQFVEVSELDGVSTISLR